MSGQEVAALRFGVLPVCGGISRVQRWRATGRECGALKRHWMQNSICSPVVAPNRLHDVAAGVRDDVAVMVSAWLCKSVWNC